MSSNIFVVLPCKWLILSIESLTWLGKLLDWDYRRTAKEAGHEINLAAGDELSGFPIEYARLRSIWYLGAIDIIGIIGFGWALHINADVH